MIKESRYILRRILIGVGIVLVLSFLNGCKVKAFESTNSIRDYNYYMNNSDYTFLTTNTYLFNNISNTNYYFYDTNNNLTVALSNGSFNNIIDDRVSQDKNFVIVKNMRDQYQNGLIFINEPEKLYFQDNTLKYIASNGNFYFNGLKVYINNQGIPSIIYPSVWAGNGSYVYNYIFNNNYTNEDIVYSTFDIYDNNGNLIHNNDLNLSPEFISFNAIPITNNNVITSYTVQPEFSNFDTDNYDYQYSFDNNRWLSLIENEQLIRINNNSTIYIRIKDISNNEIIDSSTFTITNIGTFYDNQTYDIKFSGEYRTTNYLSDNISSKSSSIISEYQIYVDFIPKSSILTYQYQYVENGYSLDNNNWENVSSSDNGTITYVATENGTLYARILDNDNNVLKTGTFTVNSIGLLAFDSNEQGVNNIFTKLNSNINFGGPITDIINIPLHLINTISVGLAGGLTCNDYSLGSLWGTNLVIPCVNVRQHLGNSLYTTIDLIIACVMIYYILKMFGDLYTNLLFIHKNPIQDLGKRGD